MSGVDPKTADSAVEQALSAYKDCVRVLGRDPLAEVKSLMPACQQGVWGRCGNLACAGSTLQSSNRNYLTRQGCAGILAVPNALNATLRSGT